MIKRIAMLSALLLAGCQTTMTPPPRYDHPYKGELHIYRGDENYMQAQCLRFNEGNKVFGCAFAWPNSCDVYILNTEPPDNQAQILAHEIAHCNGWPTDHKDGSGPANDGGAPWPDLFLPSTR